MSNRKNDIPNTDNKKLSLNIVSKYRTPIYGLCILWIVIFHGYAIHGIDYSFGNKFLKIFASIIKVGNVGVDVFLFLSGICLYFSYSKNPDFYEFIKKRIVKLILPVWLINGIYWYIRYKVVEHLGLTAVINRLFLLQFWETGDSSIWFVSCIFVLYLLYPYINRFLYQEKQNKQVIIRGTILLIIGYLLIICFSRVNPSLYNNIEIALTRFPVFILGCIMGKFVQENIRIPRFYSIFFLLGSALFFVITHFHPFGGYKMRFFYAVGGVALAYTFSIFFFLMDYLSKNRKSILLSFFSFLGTFSLELYLSHIMILQVYRLMPFYEVKSFVGYLVVMILSIILAWVISKICAFIRKKCFAFSKSNNEMA